MNDLISRQAAIACAVPLNLFGREVMMVSVSELENLPSAQPDYIMNEWCTDCKEYDHEKHCCPRYNRVIRTALQDVQPEIIRCKDCKYFERDIQRSWGTYNGCGVWTDDGNETEVKLDDFCSYAERREE